MDLVRSLGSKTTSIKTDSESEADLTSKQSDVVNETKKHQGKTSSNASMHQSKTRRSLITRTNLYKTIEKKLNA